MGRLIVYEMVDERVPKFGDVYLSYGGHPLVSSCNDDPEDKERTILRRLTDEEVAARLHSSDSDRARFVRETAARLFVVYGDVGSAVKDAESLAAKVFP